MMKKAIAIAAAVTFAALMSADFVDAAPTCSESAFPSIPDVRITAVTHQTTPAPNCKVSGVIGTETNFELLLPDTWNGKFVMGGGGGFAGFVMNTALLYGAVQKGYATVGTDTGHSAHPLDASWALNNLERVVSFGHQAVHRTAVSAKALISSYYGQDILHSYFTGCSRGGGQALMEAQRYPGDFDGIVAGAPAYNWTDMGARLVRLNRAMYPDPEDLSVAVIGPGAQELIGNAVMAQCDGLDGLTDGILNNPAQCSFDVSSLACEGGKTNMCLSEQEVNAARAIYDDLVINEDHVVFGYPVGGELSPHGWARWLTGGLDPVGNDPRLRRRFPSFHFAFGNGIMKYLVFHDPDWDYTTYTFSTFESDVAAAAQVLNATDPDIDAFRARGGKLLMFSGWADMALTPAGTIEYYQSVLDRDASAAPDIRLFMMPGVDHCTGGAGPSFSNHLDAIDSWVETGEAPDQLTAFWLNDQRQPDGSRPVCAYPKVVTYNGSGNPRDASSFSCEDS